MAGLKADGHRQMGQYPWYKEQSLELPLAADSNDVATCVNALRLDGQRNNVDFLDVRSELLLVGQFNETMIFWQSCSAANRGP